MFSAFSTGDIFFYDFLGSGSFFYDDFFAGGC
jgi:hypothetical protein